MRAAFWGVFGFALTLFCGRAEGDVAPTPPELGVACAVETPRVLAEADDPAWSGPQAGVPLPALSQLPVEKAQAFAAWVEMRWDARFLYVRFWCLAPEAPWSPYGDKRDAPHYQGDAVELFIDPVGDARQFVEIQQSAANGLFEKLYLLTGEPRYDKDGVLAGDVIRRDEWEFPGWDAEQLRSATAEWREDGRVVGWIADLALPAQPLLRRLDVKTYQAGMALHAHLVRIASPKDMLASGGRDHWFFSWVQTPLGRPHRTPDLMGTLKLGP